MMMTTMEGGTTLGRQGHKLTVCAFIASEGDPKASKEMRRSWSQWDSICMETAVARTTE